MRLEVGCGCTKGERDPPKGRYPFRPRLKGSDVVYLELKPPEAGVNPRLAWVVGDAHRLPFADQCFEEVASSHLLEHLDDPLQALREMRRVLREGGECRIWIPNWTTDLRIRHPDHKHRFTFFALRSLVRQAGFRSVVAPTAGFSSIMPKRLAVLAKALVLLLCDELYLIAWR